LTEPTIRKRRVPLLIAVSKSDLTQRAPEDVRSELEKEL
jgi:signal recognition particle receptor subunit beta